MALCQESIHSWARKDRQNAEKDPRFVSKHTLKNSRVPSNDATVRNGRQKMKPPVPRRSDRPVYGIQTSKDFVVTNAIEVILSVPKVRAGARARYVNKRDYGKRPTYLNKVEAEIQAEKAMLREMSEEQRALEQRRECEKRGAQPAVSLPEHERKELLRQLKHRWSEANTEYQKKAHIELLDTQSMVDTKTRLENNLSEIERAIKALSKANICVQG